MSRMLEQIKARATALSKKIVLCEGEDIRVVEAAAIIAKEKIAKIVLIGTEEECAKIAPDVDLTGVEIVNPETHSKTAEYAKLLFELRKDKGMTEDLAAVVVKDRTTFGALMLKSGDVDGYVSGACHSTANTLRPGLQIIKTAPSTKLVSSCFLMIPPEKGNKYCSDDLLIFGDCALSINPSADDLAEIAIASADTAKTIGGIIPKVAMLSFSTLGSGNDAKFNNSVARVKEAIRFVRDKAPDLILDGEFQFDAALVPAVAKIKAPQSSVAGNANVFIFPDINSGNIGYKIAERLGGFTAVGPICQGFAKPLNDLSRGCSREDIILTVAVTALQAGA